MVRFSRRIGGIPRDTYTPTACVRLPTIVHETLVSGRGRYLRPIDSQRATLCNLHMNARSTPTGRRSLQVLATSPAVRSDATVQRRLPSHNTVQDRGTQRWAWRSRERRLTAIRGVSDE